MLHPSYTELMDAVNSEVKEGEQPIVSSRYSIVIAAAKRARQIIAGAESAVPDYKNKKPLSVAVEELMDGDVKILSSGEDADDEDDKPSIGGDVYDIALDVDDEDIFEDEMKEDSDEDSEGRFPSQLFQQLLSTTIHCRPIIFNRPTDLNGTIIPHKTTNFAGNHRYSISRKTHIITQVKIVNGLQKPDHPYLK